jgi:alanine racemase
MVESLARAAAKADRRIAVHLKVDTGMGRIGIQPEAVTAFPDRCRAFPTVFVKGLMSHFPCVHASDKAFSHQQIEISCQVQGTSRGYGITVYHCANSAVIFDLPEA